jgi:phosphoribosyl 1,2-cyclic phosphate phosphodiesterase
MRIQILGTAAAEGWPAVFCGCETCVRARAAGGRNLRSRASIQIDDIHKIDLPPDTYYHVIRHGLDLSKLAHLFVTHSHGDHLDLVELGFSRPPFAHDLANAPIKVYGNETVTSAISARSGDKLPIELITLKPFEPVSVDSLVFTPIEAHHNPNELCLNYVVESDSATALYASDTGEYEQPTLDFLKSREFDLLIIECTQGTLPWPATNHMSFEAVLRLRDALTRSGGARTIITHFSHNIGLLHDELEAVAGTEGVEVAYDGIVLEV